MDRVTALADAVHGTVLFVGATDTGKTTLAQALLACLEERGCRVAYLDCDVGQTTVGPPSTLGVRWRAPGGGEKLRLYFVGSISPRGHFLPAIIGAAALLQVARHAGNDVTLVDTSGLVDPAAGGVALKLWKCEALRPDYLVALQREDELGPILRGVRHRLGERLLLLEPEPQVRRRERRERMDYRRERWARYFAGAHQENLRLRTLDVWGRGRLEPGRLLGLDGSDGLCLGLGVVIEARPGEVQVLTPVSAMQSVVRLRIGALRLSGEWTEVP